MTSNNAIIPIAYYILKKGNPESFILSINYKDDREKIDQWLKCSLLKRSFSGQPDNVLNPITKVIQENTDAFPIDQIVERFKGTNKSLKFTEEDLESLLTYKYNEAYSFSVLSLLYPTLDYRNQFHKDHIHPKSFFKKSELRKKGIPDWQHERFIENVDYIGNLQLMEGLPNEEKNNTDFKEWLENTYPNINERKEVMRNNYIPENIDFSFRNFPMFIEERNKLILNALRKILL